MKFKLFISILFFFVFLLCAENGFAQEQKGTGPGGTNAKMGRVIERSKRRAAKKEAKEKRKAEKANQKAIKKHHKRLQTKEVRKRMKKSKKKAAKNSKRVN